MKLALVLAMLSIPALGKDPEKLSIGQRVLALAVEAARKGALAQRAVDQWQIDQLERLNREAMLDKNSPAAWVAEELDKAKAKMLGGTWFNWLPSGQPPVTVFFASNGICHHPLAKMSWQRCDLRKIELKKLDGRAEGPTIILEFDAEYKRFTARDFGNGKPLSGSLVVESAERALTRAAEMLK